MNLDAAQLRQLYEPKPLKVLENGCEYSSVRFSPCGKFLVGAGFDSLIHRWDATQDELPELAPVSGHGGWVTEVAFTPDGGLLLTADSWGQLRASSLADGSFATAWTMPAAHDGWIVALAASPDGRLAATSGMDKKVRVWSVADGAKLQEFDHPESVQSVRFHPDGAALISGDLKGTLRHWDLANGTCTRQIDAGVLFKLDRLQDVGGVRALAFNAAGTLLACGGTKPANGGTIQGIPCVLVFDWASGELKHTVDLGGSSDVSVSDLVFHADGFLMAGVCGGPGVGKLVYRLPEEGAAFFETPIPNCHSLSLHPAGYRLALAGTNSGSNGNGRNLDANGQYPGNWSPIHLLDMPRPAA